MRYAQRRFKQMSGGGDTIFGEKYTAGIDVNGISKMNPSTIPGILLWIQAVDSMCAKKTIQEYISDLPPSIADSVRQQYPDKLAEEVIVEIRSPLPSQPNSLIRLDLSSTTKKAFPKLVYAPDRLNAISIQDLIDPNNPKQPPQKMITKVPLNVPEGSDVTIYSICTNITIKFRKIVNHIILEVIDLNQTETTLSEILVFSGKPTPAEIDSIEGYIAYRKNEQYMLRPDHPYLPSITSFPILADLAKDISQVEQVFQTSLPLFDVAVEGYAQKLPNAEILQKAPDIKNRGSAAGKQIASIRQALIKGALISRKNGTQTLDSVFENINKMATFSDPFTKEKYDQKIKELRDVSIEFDAYMKSLGDIDTHAETVAVFNNEKEQKQKRSSAQTLESVEELQEKTATTELYSGLRKRMEAINLIGATRYDSMYDAFRSSLAAQKDDNFGYYKKAVGSQWNILFTQYQKLSAYFKPGENAWLRLAGPLDTTNETVMRGTEVYTTHYVNPQLNRIQVLYEQIRNQMEEGDIRFLHSEITYHSATITKMHEAIDKRLLSPISKSMLLSYCKQRLELVVTYESEFKKLHTVISEAVTTLLDLMFDTGLEPLEKDFPIPLTFKYENSADDVYIRMVNKHDGSLTMMEYIVTNKDGKIFFNENLECDFVFPSLEVLNKSEDGKTFSRVSYFRDQRGAQRSKKYIVLEPYKKGDSILDSIPKSQILPRFFHRVDGLFEVPRDAENGIYELSMETPQMPVLLPKHAMTEGAFFICINVGKLPFHIRIPGSPEDILDLLGPGEICMYIYTDLASDSKDTYYGRVPWIKNRIAYDTLYDVPRTTICCKVKELSKYVYMQTATLPLFDMGGYLVEAFPDKDGIVYDMDDVVHSNPYKITVGTDMSMSDLEVRAEWGEQLVPSPDVPRTVYVVEEELTRLPVFCNYNGVPAINEFGYTKYLRTPIIQKDDKLKTRSSMSDYLEIVLNPGKNITQYGLQMNRDLFKRVYRSRFVKLVNGAFIFVNSAGFPLVSSSNTYIRVENATFIPPIGVEYMENTTKELAFIAEESSFFIPSKTVLEVAERSPFDMDWNSMEAKRALEICSYRFETNKAYIQYTLNKLNEGYLLCNSDEMTRRFSNIEDVKELLEQRMRKIKDYQADFLKKEAELITIITNNALLHEPENQRPMISTFDAGLKGPMKSVYDSYMIGKRAMDMFLNLVEQIEKIRKQTKKLRDVTTTENEASITNIQSVIRNESMYYGLPQDADLNSLLSKCTAIKLQFDAGLTTLETNLTKIPQDISDIGDWLIQQRTLLKNEYALRHEIVELETKNLTSIFARKILNRVAEYNTKMTSARAEMENLIEYKAAIAKWLGIHPDERQYSEEVPSLFPNKRIKGRVLTFPVFEEMENPHVSRDWVGLTKTALLSDQLKARITMGIVDPIRAFTEKYRDYYTNLSVPVPEAIADERKSDAAMEQMLKKYMDTVNNAKAEAIQKEAELEGIFKTYGEISTDIASEIRVTLGAQATEIQNRWLKCTENRAAIQTKMAVIQPYLGTNDATDANKILADLDIIFNQVSLSKVEEVQQSSKVEGFYSKMGHLKLIELHHTRSQLLPAIKGVEEGLDRIEESLGDLEANVLLKLQADLEKSRADLSAMLTKEKADASARSDLDKLKYIQDTIQPKVDAVMAENPSDIAACIRIKKEIYAIAV